MKQACILMFVISVPVLGQHGTSVVSDSLPKKVEEPAPGYWFMRGLSQIPSKSERIARLINYARTHGLMGARKDSAGPMNTPKTGASVRTVVPGSQQNSIELTLNNQTSASVEGVSVCMENTPAWLNCETVSLAGERIAPGGSRTVTLHFAIKTDAPLGSEEPVVLAARASNGTVWGQRITLRVSPPDHFGLFQNYPNPFNPTTTIGYQLPLTSRVSLRVYDVLGRQVKALLDKEMSPGFHEVSFDGSQFASGIYFYRIEAKAIPSEGGASYASTRKLMLLK